MDGTRVMPGETEERRKLGSNIVCDHREFVMRKGKTF